MFNRKLLAVDMDGTLFNDDKTISKENLEAITKLLDNGHAFAFNTGRPNHALKEILSELIHDYKAKDLLSNQIKIEISNNNNIE